MFFCFFAGDVIVVVFPFVAVCWLKLLRRSCWRRVWICFVCIYSLHTIFELLQCNLLRFYMFVSKLFTLLVEQNKRAICWSVNKKGHFILIKWSAWKLMKTRSSCCCYWCCFQIIRRSSATQPNPSFDKNVSEPEWEFLCVCVCDVDGLFVNWRRKPVSQPTSHLSFHSDFISLFGS